MTTTTTTTLVAPVTDATFQDEVLASDRPVLVEFTADWCGPCRQIAPVLAELAAAEADRLKIVALDVDFNPATAAAHRVLSAPTLILFRSGEPVLTLVGARPLRRLRQDLASELPWIAPR
ncbi:thioredoxin family protein [Streptomyces huiliensis]|uniref:thioredoxin family protein n=1 Tax=Streptomyces huiliensis TaxID=2876027 RepID=UPI001CBC61AB|nr:thioredoxin domain-containing protein [Streptomyces huiliensis]MBZ4323727.1 thiol reductase thioredoxin [Streptomyces huiliensis]